MNCEPITLNFQMTNSKSPNMVNESTLGRSKFIFGNDSFQWNSPAFLGMEVFVEFTGVFYY